jgi:type IV pilus assembly protein PilF
MKTNKLYIIIPALLFFATILTLSVAAQEKKQPQFPPENKNVVFIEGEDAVSTNFAVEATLNYRASGSRTLQLNRSVGLQGGSAFFAEYVFYVEEEGTFQFWYGGTPPGPESDLYPSYSSPFRYSVDDGEPVPVYWEKAQVTQRYLPAFYWVRAGEVHLEKGIHRIKIEVNEKRKYDGKYYYYIDNLFFVRKDAITDPGEPLPGVFPAELDTENNIEFYTIASYEEKISQQPEDMERYKDLALVYSLLGEYINALKTLQRARFIEPENTDLTVLAAKNRIWKGDLDQGLGLYKEALQNNSNNAVLWAEAGKIAAWSGKYQEAVFFYTSGLEQFPEDLNLTVNLGLTYLWMSEPEEADQYFETSFELASEDPALLKELAEIYRINGYPGRAAEVYKQAIKQFPERIVFYLQLENLYTSQGKDEEAAEVLQQMSSTFVKSEKLQQYIDTFTLKKSLRERVIEDYIRQVEEQPDNIELRQMLVQTYFWNGRREEAIQQYLYILANYGFRHFMQLDNDSEQLMQLLDIGHLYYTYFNRFSNSVRDRERELNQLASSYEQALRDYNRYQKKQEEDPEAPEDTTVVDQYEEARDALVAFISAEQARLSTVTGKLYQYESDVEAIAEVKEKAAEEKQNFKDVTEGLDWEWERNFHLRELETIFRDNSVLAGHVLAKIYQIENRFSTAEQILSQVTERENVQPASIAAYAETLLWRGKWNELRAYAEKHSSELSDYLPYYQSLLDSFSSFLETPQEEETFIAISPDAIQEEITDLKESYAEQKKQVDEIIKQNREDLNVLHTILQERMERQFYHLESETHLIRYELGKYYLEENKLVEATRQLEKVLDVDPWNIDAKFKLGTVRQRIGDWGQAMQKYREVYNDDPFYPNAATYYNQLAREHPDIFTLNTQLFGDSQRIHFKGEAEFTNRISTLFSWRGTYAFDSIRLYKTYEEEEDSSHQLYTFSLGFPVDLYFINLTITPSAGLTLSSQLFENDILAESDEALLMKEFFGYWDVHPILSGTVSFSLPNFTVDGTYTYGGVKDTFVPERKLLTSHTGELSVFYSFAGLNVPFLKYSSVRAHGKMQFVEDKNIIGTAVEEAILGIHLFDNPWTTLNVLQNVTFEHSKIPSEEKDNGYYAPDSTLLVKGGISGSSWFTLRDQSSLGVSLNAAAGGYWESLAAEEKETPGFQLEGNLRLEYGKSKSSYYLSLVGSQTWDVPDWSSQYWSLSINVGVHAKVIDLLAP